MADGEHHGGKRKGAGRPKGSKQKIAKTFLTKSALVAAGDGEMPLQYMLRVMRDPEADEKRRDAMATAAATYIHPKLSTVTGTFKHQHEPSDLSDAELARIAAGSSAGAVEPADGAEEPARLH